MNSEASSGSKKRRIMIITADESLIEQIQNNGNASLFKSIVLDSNGDNVEFSSANIPTTPSDASSPVHKKSKTGSLTCVVCGAAAHGYNFDAISCESCKAFFRRNALKDPKTLECRRSSECNIVNTSRRRCAACRLKKCFNSGMKRDRLLTTEQREAKLRKIEQNRSMTFQTHSEDQNDKFVSSIDKEKSSSLSTTVLTHLSTSKNTNLLLVKDVTELLPVIPKQDQRTLLSSADLHRVETVQSSYEQRIELAARDGLPWNPSLYASTLLEHVNAHSVSALRLVSFFKQIPEFNQLNVHDRVTLIKYNLMPLGILNCTLFYNTEPNNVLETNSDAPLNSSMILNLHGNDIYQRVKKIFESFVRIAQNDHRIIQLALIVLILTKGSPANGSSSEPTLNDSLAVYRAQNYYTELLWKYLETVHGCGKAVHIFNELVAHFISWQMLQGHMSKRLLDALTPTEMNELLPIMKSLLHIT